MPFVVQFLLALPVGQPPKDFGIVRVLIEPIIGFGVNRLKVIVSIDRLRNEVYQKPRALGPFLVRGRLDWRRTLVPPLWQPTSRFGKAPSISYSQWFYEINHRGGETHSP